MERAEVLIERLLDQYRNNVGQEKLMITARLLMAELQKGYRDEQQAPEQKISVFFPGFSHFSEAEAETLIEENPKTGTAGNEKEKPPVETVVHENGGRYGYYDPVTEIPTLALKQQEINETIAKSESLNDKLKLTSSRTEIVHTIKDSPVKDLRKAIGINDRYLFINELFRGDETMYERSIKTINGFNIYGEAEFWIKRELKLKLAWKEDTEAVQIFDQLIKRRFS
jgi:hypothetical protein